VLGGLSSEYVKLLRNVGIGQWWSGLNEHVDHSNPHVMRFYNYLKEHVVKGSGK